MDPNNEVMVAFEILLGEIETVVAGFNEEGQTLSAMTTTKLQKR